KIHLVTGHIAAAVDVEHVAVLEGAVRPGRAQHHRRLGRQISAAFDVVAQHVLLERRGGDARLELFEGATPRDATNRAGLASAVDLPLGLDQTAPPYDWTGVGKARLRHLLLQQFEIDHRNAEPRLAAELDGERAGGKPARVQDLRDAPIDARLRTERD